MNPTYRQLIEAEVATREASDRDWTRLDILRKLVRDHDLTEMLEINDDVLLLAFAKLHQAKEASDAQHHEATERLTRGASRARSSLRLAKSFDGRPDVADEV